MTLRESNATHSLPPEQRFAVGSKAKTPIWSHPDFRVSLEREQKSLSQMMNFIEAPVRWNLEDIEELKAGRAPIQRLQESLTPFLEHQYRMKLSLIGGAVTLLVVFILLGLGINQGIESAPKPIQQAFSFLATSNTPLPETPEVRAEEAESPKYQEANMDITKAVSSPFQKLPFREDPFRPLISLDWWQRLIDSSANSGSEDQLTLQAQSSGYPTAASAEAAYSPRTPTSSQMSAMPPAESIPFTIDQALEFVGIVADANNSNKATVLLKATEDGSTVMLSKNIGDAFTFDGHRIVLKSLRKGTLTLNVNGFPQQLTLAEANIKSSIGEAIRPPGPATDDEIKQILDDLEQLS